MQKAQTFIAEEFEKRRARNPNFSLRSFAKWLGLSPAQVSQMMTGKRNVTFKTLKKMSERLGLSALEKKALMTSLLGEKDFIEPDSKKRIRQTLKEDEFALVADWYHFAILSLTKLKGAKADPRWIGRRLGIKPETAHSALRRLHRLGLVRLAPELKQIGEPLEVISQTPSAAIQKYHRQNLNLAHEKLEIVPVKFRQFQSQSIALTPKLIPRFTKLIDEFLEEAAQLATAEPPTEIYNLNVQLYPVTHSKELK